MKSTSCHVWSIERTRGLALRRLLWPVVILAVGGALSVWASQRQARRMDQIEQAVQALCRDVVNEASAESDQESLRPRSDFVSEQVRSAIRSVCPDAQTFDQLKIHVAPGDSSGLGGKDSAGYVNEKSSTATHSAILRLGGQDMLGLRIRKTDDTQPMMVLGYWMPAIQ